jgi:hypothetical protein
LGFRQREAPRLAIVFLPERLDTWLAHFLLSQRARIFFISAVASGPKSSGSMICRISISMLPPASEVGQRFAQSMASCLEFTRMMEKPAISFLSYDERTIGYGWLSTCELDAATDGAGLQTFASQHDSGFAHFIHVLSHVG